MIHQQSLPKADGAILLAGDIGGTKTTLALYSAEAGPYEPVAKATFPSAAHASLEAIVAAIPRRHARS